MADAKGIDTPEQLAEFAAGLLTVNDYLLIDNLAHTTRKLMEGQHDTVHWVSTEKRHAIYMCEMIKRGLL